MKKTLVVGLAIGLVSLAASAAFAGPSAVRAMPDPGYSGQKNTGGAGIVGSSHDLSNVGETAASITASGFAGRDLGTGVPSDKQSRICVYCHHPHNARPATANGTQMEYSPLWDRNMSTGNFTGYNNGIMMGTSTSDQQHMLNAANHGGTALGGVSLLCMSCHDGVVAMNAYSQGGIGSATNSGDLTKGGPITGTAAFTASAGVASNMNNHHPMGFSYSAVQAVDSEIASVDVTMVPTTGVTIGELLYGTDNTMECVTCHDVHNTLNQTGAERFLWRSNNESNFCLTCHLK